jgi:hypothetical protein
VTIKRLSGWAKSKASGGSVTDTIKALWFGLIPMPVSFWRYAVVWGLIINFTTSLLTVITILADAPVWPLVPVHLLPTPYNLLVVVGVWRSAERYEGPRKWADLARFMTIIGMTILTAT